MYESVCILVFSVSFNSSSSRRNLVFFHHIHYWHISCREAAVVPEQLALGQSGGACLIRKTIRMESAQQSLVMRPGAKSHCWVSLLAGCHCCCTYKHAHFHWGSLVLHIRSPLNRSTNCSAPQVSSLTTEDYIVSWLWWLFVKKASPKKIKDERPLMHRLS